MRKKMEFLSTHAAFALGPCFMSTKHRILLAFFLLMIVWPAGFTAISVAVRAFSPFEVAALRLTIAGAIMFAYAVISGMPAPDRHDLPLLLFTGAYGLVGYNVGLGIAQHTITPAEASLVVAMTPICVVIFSAIFLGEKIGWRTVTGILLGFSGVAIISLSKEGGFTFDVGVLFALLAMSSQTTLTLLQKKFLGRYTAMQITVFSTIAGSLAALPFGYTGFAHLLELGVGNESTVAILVLALSSSVLGYFLWAYLLTHLPAGKTSSFLYFNPVLVVLISWLWIGTVPDISTVIGGVVTMTGIAIVNIRRTKKTGEPVIPAAAE